jgi:hypothetical protein
MVRFIINFFLFGFLFYLIWHFFPGAFTTLVSWADSVFEFVKNFVVMLWNKIFPSVAPTTPTPVPVPEDSQRAISAVLLYLVGRN